MNLKLNIKKLVNIFFVVIAISGVVFLFLKIVGSSESYCANVSSAKHIKRCLGKKVTAMGLLECQRDKFSGTKVYHFLKFKDGTEIAIFEEIPDCRYYQQEIKLTGILYECDSSSDQCQGAGLKNIEPLSPATGRPEKVVIATEKINYEKGEKIKVNFSNGLKEGVKFFGEKGCSGQPLLFLKEGKDKKWSEINVSCGSCQNPIEIKVGAGEMKTLEIEQVILAGPYREDAQCEKINLLPGNYQFKFYAMTDSDEIARISGEIYSNQFAIKSDIPKSIADRCEADQRKILSIRTSQACSEGGFCQESWESKHYYDKRATTTQEFPRTSFNDMPQEMRDELKGATMAIFQENRCSCEKPISYKILLQGFLKETECEDFYNFVERYKVSCQDCLLEWSEGCCQF